MLASVGRHRRLDLLAEASLGGAVPVARRPSVAYQVRGVATALADAAVLVVGWASRAIKQGCGRKAAAVVVVAVRRSVALKPGRFGLVSPEHRTLRGQAGTVVVPTFLLSVTLDFECREFSEIATRSSTAASRKGPSLGRRILTAQGHVEGVDGLVAQEYDSCGTSALRQYAVRAIGRRGSAHIRYVNRPVRLVEGRAGAEEPRPGCFRSCRHLWPGVECEGTRLAEVGTETRARVLDDVLGKVMVGEPVEREALAGRSRSIRSP